MVLRSFCILYLPSSDGRYGAAIGPSPGDCRWPGVWEVGDGGSSSGTGELPLGHSRPHSCRLGPPEDQMC